MCDYTKKITEMIIQIYMTILSFNSDNDIFKSEIINIICINTYKNECNIECNCKYLYNIIKFLHKVLNKDYQLHITCEDTECKECKQSKHKLKYLKQSNCLSNIIKNNNIKTFNKNSELYDNIDKTDLFKTLPTEIVNKIINGHKLIGCKENVKLTEFLSESCHYNILNNLIFKKQQFKKNIKIFEICKHNDKCKDCKIVLLLISLVMDIINYDCIEYTTCSTNEYNAEDCDIYGFLSFTYSFDNDKTITTGDYIRLANYEGDFYD